MNPATASLSSRRIFALWWPLAASSLLMSAEFPIINAGIARKAGPDAALAGFAIAASLATLIEAPILMMIGAAAALATDRAMVRLLRRFTAAVALVMTGIYCLVSFTPIADRVLRDWLGLPPPVADACLPAFRILIFWPLATGWRRLHQGILIRMRRTRVISAGTIIRLCFSLLLTVLNITVLPWPGAVGGAVTTAGAVVLEAVLITYWARRILPELDDAPAPHMNYRQVLVFYLPLMMVSLMTILAQPAISAGLARAPFPTESLASWSILWGLTTLIGSVCNPLQETTISLAERRDATRVIRRFGLALGAAASGFLALLALTPLADLYFGQLIGLSPELRAVISPAILLVIPVPFLVACEMMLRGLLIRQRRTTATRLAMGAYMVMLGAGLAAGVALQWGTGTQIAATAALLALGGEIGVLAWHAAPVPALQLAKRRVSEGRE
ncbi:MAG: hypothetical protein HY259_09110 [Chloroflexi bacterium]|nr:hypothetical protein [Chloroflexota bacterium]